MPETQHGGSLVLLCKGTRNRLVCDGTRLYIVTAQLLLCSRSSAPRHHSTSTAKEALVEEARLISYRNSLHPAPPRIGVIRSVMSLEWPKEGVAEARSIEAGGELSEQDHEYH